MTAVLGPAGMRTAGIVQLTYDDDFGPGDGVTWRVEFAYYAPGAGAALWNSATWDNDDWLSGAPTPSDVARDVVSINIVRGRGEPLERFQPGSCSVVIDDPLGELSPWANNPPEKFGPIRPNIKMTVVAEYKGVDKYRFTGSVSSIVDTFPDILAGGHAIEVVAYDGLTELARFDGLEHAPVGADETAGPRLNRIITDAAYTGPTNFQTGIVTLQATTLAGNALENAGLVADTELGALYVDREGVLQFYDRNGILANPHFTDVQYGFGEQAGELCYSDVQLVTDQERVRNILSIANVDGTPVTHEDGDSIALYGPRTYERTDLIHSNEDDSAGIADAYLDSFANAVRRVESLTILPGLHAEVIPAALDIDLLWRIQLRRRATGFEVLAELQVETITEDITPHEWIVTYRTFSADAVFAVGTWNNAEWDTGVWGY